MRVAESALCPTAPRGSLGPGRQRCGGPPWVLARTYDSCTLRTAPRAPAPIPVPRSPGRAAAVPSLRSAPRNALTAPAGARQVDPNEPRNHPDFDAPASKMKEAGNLVPSGTPPAEPHPDFRRNHPDFDAPVEKQLKAGNIKPTPEA